MLPKHKYLLTYRYSEMVHDLVVVFCQRYVLRNLSNLKFPDRRTADQMIQAARSGKQNIVEGVGQSQTSKKGEIKLLGVAKASLEELITDLEDFLRQHNLRSWSKTDPQILQFRQIGFALSHLRNLSNLGNLTKRPELPDNPEGAANFLLTLCHQATFLLDRQIKKAEEKFITEGGYSENLLKKRLQAKIS